MRRSSQLAVVNNSENNRKLICTFWRLLAPERKIMPCSVGPTTDPPWSCDLWFPKSKLMMIHKARLRFHIYAHLLSSKWWWLDPSFMYGLWAQLSFRAEQRILSPAAAHNSETGVSLTESLLIGKEMSLMITTNVTWWVCCQELGDYPLLMWSCSSLKRLKKIFQPLLGFARPIKVSMQKTWWQFLCYAVSAMIHFANIQMLP